MWQGSHVISANQSYSHLLQCNVLIRLELSCRRPACSSSDLNSVPAFQVCTLTMFQRMAHVPRCDCKLSTQKGCALCAID